MALDRKSPSKKQGWGTLKVRWKLPPERVCLMFLSPSRYEPQKSALTDQPSGRRKLSIGLVLRAGREEDY
jgi:hypothetical protein